MISDKDDKNDDNHAQSCSISFNRANKITESSQSSSPTQAANTTQTQFQGKIYIKTTCPFCLKALDLLKLNNIDLEVFDLTDNPALRQQISQKLHGYSTVPMIFLKEKFIGGCDQLEDLINQQKHHQFLK